MEEFLPDLQACECLCLETELEWARRETVWLDRCWMLVPERGAARVTVGKEDYAVDRARLLFMRPDLSLKVQETSEDFRATLICFPISMFHESLQKVGPDLLLSLFTRVVWRLEGQSRRLVEHFRELFRFAVADYGGAYSRELVQVLLTGFVYGACKLCGDMFGERVSAPDSSRSRELFRKFMELLHENFVRQHDVQFYAGRLCISAKYLTQISKRTIGLTPKQIIDGRILHEAMKLLEMNESSIQDISVRLGFSDQSYFGRFFKRMKQMSPQQYRLHPVR